MAGHRTERDVAGWGSVRGEANSQGWRSWKSWVTKGPGNCFKELELYPNGTSSQLKDCKQGSDIITHAFWKDHSGRGVNGWNMGQDWMHWIEVRRSGWVQGLIRSQNQQDLVAGPISNFRRMRQIKNKVSYPPPPPAKKRTRYPTPRSSVPRLSYFFWEWSHCSTVKVVRWVTKRATQHSTGEIAWFFLQIDGIEKKEGGLLQNGNNNQMQCQTDEL